ncbi:MAG: hypothetical protein ACF8LL_12440 [Phycisphaerales bacterium]
MRRTVVLLHTRPGQPDHFDWLIDQPEHTHEHRLITFRTPLRPDQHHRFEAEKAPDHRAFYLDYQGPLSQDRGEVTRVAQGTVLEWHFNENTIHATAKWGESTIKYLATQSGSTWRFTRPD